jgi:hypothetical protein
MKMRKITIIHDDNSNFVVYDSNGVELGTFKTGYDARTLAFKVGFDQLTYTSKRS